MDSLRKAKNNYVIKKEKEYIEFGAKNVDKKSDSFEDLVKPIQQQAPVFVNEPCKICEEEREKVRNLTNAVEVLNRDLDESKNLNGALKVQNEEMRV